MCSLPWVMAATKAQKAKFVLPFKDAAKAPAGQLVDCCSVQILGLPMNSRKRVNLCPAWPGPQVNFIIFLLYLSIIPQTPNQPALSRWDLSPCLGFSWIVQTQFSKLPWAMAFPWELGSGSTHTVNAFHNVNSPKAITTMLHLPKPKPNALNTTVAQLRLFQPKMRRQSVWEKSRHTIWVK